MNCGNQQGFTYLTALFLVAAVVLRRGWNPTSWELVVFVLRGMYNAHNARQLGIKSALVCATNVPMMIYWPFVLTYVCKSVALFAMGRRATW